MQTWKVIRRLVVAGVGVALASFALGLWLRMVCIWFMLGWRLL